MDRVHRLLPVGQVALRIAAIGRRNRQRIIVIDVAERASHVGVPVGEQETGRAVIENCGGPTDRVVAGGAVRGGERRAGGGMHGIVGGLPGAQVAAGVAAVGRADRQIVIVVDMAGGAGNVRVPIRQQESGRAVIEPGVQPIVKGRVAGFAGRGEFGGDVIRIGSLLEIRLMAGIAGRGKAQVISDRRIFVAFLALNDGVRAEQRKAVEVLLD